MRTTTIATIAASLVLVGSPLWAAPPGEHGNMNVYAAGACAAPGYGTQPLQPGCCQCQPNCCDDVWAGYCQKKHQGLCLPCIRPLPQRCVTPPLVRGSDCPGMIYASPPRNHLDPLPAPTPKTDAQPTPAPQLPPPPVPPTSRPGAPESSSPSDTTGAPFPVFNPAAWNIAAPLK